MILPSESDTNQNELFQVFRHALIQPPLLAEGHDLYPVELFPDKAFTEHVLTRAERYPQILTSTFTPDKRQPLGRLFEQVVHAALKCAYPDRTVFANVRLASKSHPGELDFVIANLSQTIHLEVAIKFFLYIADSLPKKSSFVGPQLKDRLDLKLDKLIAKQLAHPIPKDLIQTATAGTTRALWLTGMLCYPAQDFLLERFPDFTALGLNPLHHKGWWIRQQDIPSVFTDNYFVELAKPQWIAPLTQLPVLAIKSLPQKTDALLAEPTFVLRYSKDGEPLDRGFIVPNDWARTLPT